MSISASCPICGELADLIAFVDGGPCMNCVRARAAAVGASGRCVCGRKRIPNPDISRSHSRSWQTCLRCLGTIKQLS